ncbi:class C sortase [uncultured Catenibacterium sp.]|uniref:class C sortase n=1 Tax=uncultured Catenibacterium sp. TaxID=286142 RepID=UPI0025FE3BF2|nr:class C sortase [uncultured Catenibacterium sp.]
MRKHISTFIAVLIFITGLSLLLYPTVSNYFNSLHQSKVVANYSDKMKKMNKKEKQAAINAAKAYNKTLLLNDARFTPTEDQLAEYKSLLNADGLGMMGYIVIPKIHLKLAISHTVDASVLQVGVGHLEGSSLPVGGKSTHCVLSSHRGLPSAKLFTELDLLVEGDYFYLHVYDQVLTYEVDNIITIEPDDYSHFEIEEGKDLCTLFTCTPYGINTQRLVVRGHRVKNTIGASKLHSDAIKINEYIVAICIAVIILCTGYTIRKAIKRFRKHELQDTPS